MTNRRYAIHEVKAAAGAIDALSSAIKSELLEVADYQEAAVRIASALDREGYEIKKASRPG